MVLQMISVNQETGTSVPEKVKRGGGGTHDVYHQEGDLWMGRG